MGPITLRDAIIGALVLPPYWAPHQIPSWGPEFFGVMDGFNNPTLLMYNEALVEFAGRNLSMIVTLGSGQRFYQSTPGLTSQEIRMAASAEDVHQHMYQSQSEDQLGLGYAPRAYYRLNPTHGYTNPELAASPDARAAVLSLSWNYARDVDVAFDIRNIVDVLLSREPRRPL
jgi:hypothetical protein